MLLSDSPHKNMVSTTREPEHSSSGETFTIHPKLEPCFQNNELIEKTKTNSVLLCLREYLLKASALSLSLASSKTNAYYNLHVRAHMSSCSFHQFTRSLTAQIKRDKTTAVTATTPSQTTKTKAKAARCRRRLR